MGNTERDYMWNTLGIRDWIVTGGHMTDDWIESSCLSGMCVFVFGAGVLGKVLTGGRAECTGAVSGGV